MATQVVLGIDIGGTNTTFALINKEGSILFQQNIPTHQYVDAKQLVSRIKELLDDELHDKYELLGIGVGAPNGNYYKGTIEFAPNLQWSGIIPLAQYFKEQFSVPAYLTNDFAGELGHVIVEENGRQCGCGRKGCLETYSSVTGIKNTVVELLSQSSEESELRGFKNEDLSGKIIEQAAIRGDAIAQKAFGITGEYLGKALANIIAITSPKAIVLFGGLAQSGDLIFKPTEYFMNRNVLKIYEGKVQLIPSALKSNEAALLGAAALAWREIG